MSVSLKQQIHEFTKTTNEIYLQYHTTETLSPSDRWIPEATALALLDAKTQQIRKKAYEDPDAVFVHLIVSLDEVLAVLVGAEESPKKAKP